MNPLRIFLVVFAIICAIIGAPLILTRATATFLLAIPFFLSTIVDLLLANALDKPQRPKNIAIAHSVLTLILTAFAEIVVMATTGLDCLDVCIHTPAQMLQTRLLYGSIVFGIGLIVSALPWLWFRRHPVKS